MQEQIIKCPNCGANATNHQNCEYCGSLLVRFVDKDIDLSKTTYTSNAEVFPNLIQNLQRNLKMQDNSLVDSVATDIYREVGKQEKGVENGWVLSVLRTGMSAWGDGQMIKITEGFKGLCIAVSFDLFEDESYETRRKINQRHNAQLERFKQLDCFPLFTSHTYSSSWRRNANSSCFTKTKVFEYAIDFGEDAEGAARLISEFMQKVHQIPLTENIDILTNQGANIDIARSNAIDARTPSFDNIINIVSDKEAFLELWPLFLGMLLIGIIIMYIVIAM